MGCTVLLAVVLYFSAMMLRPLDLPADKVYVFSPGQSANDLIKMLRDDDIIDHAFGYVVMARFSGYARQLKAGEYRFEPDSSILDVFEHVAAGKSVDFPITFIEGWTFADFLRELSRAQNLVKTLSGLSVEEILSTLHFSENHPEGWFFPDTYRYTSRQSDVEILATAHKRMQEILDHEWADRSDRVPYESAYQALIAASIIQKEAQVESEFRTISGVIVNRLERRMRLQMDPTVIYGLGGEYIGVIRQSDLKRDTPYNTYTRSGLPPTPIAMPGRAAIRAAMHPELTTALYFVSRGDGTHQFTDNLEDHLKAVREYRKLLRNRTN